VCLVPVARLKSEAHQQKG